MTAGLAPWLRCPTCARDLEEVGAGRLGCPSGHRFELNKRGYAGLVRESARLPNGPRGPELDAIDARFGSGLLDPLLAAVDAVTPAAAGGRLLDLSGTGGHLASALLAHRPGWRALVLSSSPALVARAMTRSGADGLLCDPTRDWPVRTGAASVLLGAFAPHMPAEFHRVLAPGGVLVAAAGSSPLGGAIDVSELQDDVDPWFEFDQARTVALTEGGTTVVRFRRRRRPL